LLDKIMSTPCTKKDNEAATAAAAAATDGHRGPLEVAIANRMGLTLPSPSMTASSTAAAITGAATVTELPPTESEKNNVKQKITSDMDTLLNNRHFTKKDLVELEQSWGKICTNINEKHDRCEIALNDEAVLDKIMSTKKDNEAAATAAAATDGSSIDEQKKHASAVSTSSASSSKSNAAAVPTASSSSASIIAIKSDNDNNSRRPKKKGKVQHQYYLEIKWYEYDVENDKDIYHTMFVDEIPKGTKFSDCRAFQKKYEGENHQYSISFCLVDSKSEDRKIMVEIGTDYWYLPINLMHFHILSQDLANFSRKLWVAAGKNEDVYDDMSIEFGHSKIGKWEVKKLVGLATGIKRKSDVLYMSRVKMHDGSTVEHSLRLLEMVFKTCKSAIVIAYDCDLKKLDVVENFDGIGFTKMSNLNCYIGPNRKI